MTLHPQPLLDVPAKANCPELAVRGLGRAA